MRAAVGAILGASLLSVAPVMPGSGIGTAAAAPRNRVIASAANTRAPRVVEAPASPEDAFVQARRFAMAEPDAERFEQVADRASELTLLQPYIGYWRLRLQLADRRLDGDPSIDAAADAFLQKQSSTMAGDMLRRDWMLNLGRRGDWSRFNELYRQWVLRDDSQVECYRLAGAASNGEPVTLAAQALLLQQRELSEGCAQLLDTMVRVGAFNRDALMLQFRSGLETNSPGTIRRVGGMLGLDPDRLDRALNKPMMVLANPGGRDYDLTALVRQARQDPKSAADKLDAIGFAPADKAFAYSQLAAASMRKLEPEALDWTKKALKANATDETWVWLARAALRDQDWTTLGTVIAKMSPDLQRDPTWVYWKARSLRAKGKREEADELQKTIADQYNFYGQLAAEDLGRLSSTPPRAATPTPDELAQAQANEGLARALKFYDLGLRFEGNREWNFELRTMNDRQLLATADFACRRQVLDRCVNTADKTIAEHDFALRFISPFLEQMRSAADEQGLDPAWVYGLIRQESRFIMNARSSVGAQGLMQMMPSTAKWVARKMGVPDYRAGQLNEIDTNLKFGTFYLRTVYDGLDSSPLLASAAYNAGPNRPKNWRATLPGTVEGAVFAEIIPFTETRDYVKKVLSNTTYYAALFSGQPQSLKSRLGMVVPTAVTPTDAP